jgi:excisionase family DNA binding protein
MKQKRTIRNRTKRITRTSPDSAKTVRDGTGQKVQNGTANESVAVAQAGRRLGVDRRTIRRLCDTGRLQSFTTPGGHRRIAVAELEAFQNGRSNTDAKIGQSSLSSPSLQLQEENLKRMRLEIEERKMRSALRELDRTDREEAQQREAERRAEEQAAQKARREHEEARQEQERQKEEARQEHFKQEWSAEMVEAILNELPADVPLELRSQVADAVEQEAQGLFALSLDREDSVKRKLWVVVERILYHWKRRQAVATATEAAMEAALNQLPLRARAVWPGQVSEWELRVKREASAAIAALGGAASAPDISLAAQSAGWRVVQEYERAAEVDRHLQHIFPYLERLQADRTDPDGYDFEPGEINTYAQRIRQAIRPELLAELPLNDVAGRARVEELVDEWLERETSR